MMMDGWGLSEGMLHVVTGRLDYRTNLADDVGSESDCHRHYVPVTVFNTRSRVGVVARGNV